MAFWAFAAARNEQSKRLGPRQADPILLPRRGYAGHVPDSARSVKDNGQLRAETPSKPALDTALQCKIDLYLQ
jgi:hypothetical protein